MRLPRLFRGNAKREEELVSVSEALPPDARLVDKNEFGALFIKNDTLLVLPFRRHEVWGAFAPIFTSSKVEEAWIFEGRGVVTLRGVGRVSFPADSVPDSLEELVTRIIAASGVNVSLRNPRGVADIGEWRVAIQVQSGGQLHLVATRVTSVPPLEEVVPPLLATRLVLLLVRPSTVVITGPPGSGKTTVLSALVKAVADLFPWLHIAIVEKYRELSFRGGWFTQVVSENLAEGVRYAMRYLRPDLLVVGEILAEDFWSLLEPTRAGIPTVTTFHAPSAQRALKSLSDALRVHLGGATNVLNYLDVLVVTSKVITSSGVSRGVSAVYLSDGQRLVPVYLEGEHAEEDLFKKALPDKLYVGDLVNVEKTLRERFRPDEAQASFLKELAALSLER